MSRNDGKVSGGRRGKRNKLVQRRQRRRRDKMNARGRKPEQVASEARQRSAGWT